jgi:hypothetical protein
VRRAIDALRTLTNFDALYIGGGNALKIKFELEADVKIISNEDGLKAARGSGEIQRLQSCGGSFSFVRRGFTASSGAIFSPCNLASSARFCRRVLDLRIDLAAEQNRRAGQQNQSIRIMTAPSEP